MLVSQIVISTILSEFLDGLEAEKQNVGINRTDNRQHRSRKFSPPGFFHEFVTSYLEFIITLHQDTKTVCIKDGLLCKVVCSLGEIYQFQ